MLTNEPFTNRHQDCSALDQINSKSLNNDRKADERGHEFSDPQMSDSEHVVSLLRRRTVEGSVPVSSERLMRSTLSAPQPVVVGQRSRSEDVLNATIMSEDGTRIRKSSTSEVSVTVEEVDSGDTESNAQSLLEEDQNAQSGQGVHIAGGKQALETMWRFSLAMLLGGLPAALVLLLLFQMILKRLSPLSDFQYDYFN